MEIKINDAILYIFSGLPATGKTTLSQMLAQHYKAVHLRNDTVEHRQRVEDHTATVTDLELPTWEKVVNREYDTWTTNRVIVDTAARTVDESFKMLVDSIEKYNQ